MKKHLEISLKILLIVLLCGIINVINLYAEENIIRVYCNNEIGKVNKKIFGNNFLGFDPGLHAKRGVHYYGFADYGDGIWDAKWNNPVQEVINLAKEAGISIVRFPGGCGTHFYNWKESIGKNRTHYLFGIDEFLKTCEQIGTEAVITVSYPAGDEQDAADLVEYLNSPNDGSNPNGGIDWASERAKNGHPQPYNVKYFEIGNEVWHGNHRDIKKISPEEYVNRYLKYYNAMKSIDPKIQIGLVLFNLGISQNWDETVLSSIKSKVDFVITHTYPPHDRKLYKKVDIKDLFALSLAVPIYQDEKKLMNTRSLLNDKIGRNDVPIAITEFNGGFVQNEPIPYRHCLGTALINAELLRIFLKPEHKILMANHWNFINEYWGMIANGFDGSYKNLHKPYYKRPNFYVFELYNKHFGDILLKLDVKSESYDLSKYKWLEADITNIAYLAVSASKKQDSDKIYLMVINKDLNDSRTATIDLKDFMPLIEVNAWILNGPSVDATNEKDHNKVKLRYKKIGIKNNPFEFTFEPHSLIAIEIVKRKNEK